MCVVTIVVIDFIEIYIHYIAIIVDFWIFFLS